MADQDPTPVVIPPKSPAANAPRRHRPRLLDTALLGPSRRRKLIKEIEVATGRRLLCYVSPWVNIATPDAFDLIRLLQKVHSGASITLLLDSPGGEIDPAEKMVDLLQKACQSPSGPNGDLEVVIPYQAKSAATLIALGADRIMMSDSSELGPIDPLLSSVPAVPLLRAYKKAEERCIRYPDNQAFVEEFRSFHPVIVEMMRLAVSRSRACAERLLKRQGGNHTAAPAILVDVDRFPSHSQMIDWRTALDIGIPQVRHLDRQSPLWRQYWRLYRQLTTICGATQRVFESRDESILRRDRPT